MSAILPLSGDEQTSGYDPKMTLMTRSGRRAVTRLHEPVRATRESIATRPRPRRRSAGRHTPEIRRTSWYRPLAPTLETQTSARYIIQKSFQEPLRTTRLSQSSSVHAEPSAGAGSSGCARTVDAGD